MNEQEKDRVAKMSCAVKEGKKAHADGTKVTKCPYLKNTIEQVSWVKGWMSYAPQDLNHTSDLPDEVFDKDGNKYLVRKPKHPDPNNWIQLIKA